MKHATLVNHALVDCVHHAARMDCTVTNRGLFLLIFIPLMCAFMLSLRLIAIERKLR